MWVLIPVVLVGLAGVGGAVWWFRTRRPWSADAAATQQGPLATADLLASKGVHTAAGGGAAGVYLGSPPGMVSFSDREKSAPVPSAKMPGIQEWVAMGWVLSWLKICCDAKVWDLAVMKSALSNEPPGAHGAIQFLSGMSAVGTAASKGMAAGPVGAVVAAVVAAVWSVVSSILDGEAREKEKTKLRRLATTIAYFLGPPPASLLHFAAFAGPPFYNVMRWEVQIHVHVLRLYEAMKKAGWPVEQAPMVESKQLASMQRLNKINLCPPDWQDLKPASRLGPWWPYALHPGFLFGRLRQQVKGRSDTAFYSAYQQAILGRTGSPFRFVWSDFQKIAPLVKQAPGGVWLFEEGHDPWVPDIGGMGADGSISQAVGDWRVTLNLPVGPYGNWLLAPGPGQEG